MVVGNKAKGRISKRVFQENKARQNFRKTNISYPVIPSELNAQFLEITIDESLSLKTIYIGHLMCKETEIALLNRGVN